MSEVQRAADRLDRQARVLVILAGLNCLVTAVLLGVVMAHSLAR